MRAIVLVGGEGTRMRPLTRTIPKPLLPLVDRPFLQRLLEHLGRHGVEHVTLSSPYLGEAFASFLREWSTRPEIDWVTEAEPLGTGVPPAGFWLITFPALTVFDSWVVVETLKPSF